MRPSMTWHDMTGTVHGHERAGEAPCCPVTTGGDVPSHLARADSRQWHLSPLHITSHHIIRHSIPFRSVPFHSIPMTYQWYLAPRGACVGVRRARCVGVRSARCEGVRSARCEGGRSAV